MLDREKKKKNTKETEKKYCLLENKLFLLECILLKGIFILSIKIVCHKCSFFGIILLRKAMLKAKV